jgi:hypothetical protein
MPRRPENFNVRPSRHHFVYGNINCRANAPDMAGVLELTKAPRAHVWQTSLMILPVSANSGASIFPRLLPVLFLCAAGTAVALQICTSGIAPI